MWGLGLDRARTEKGQVVGTCEWDNEPSGSTKYKEFHD